MEISLEGVTDEEELKGRGCFTASKIDVERLSHREDGPVISECREREVVRNACSAGGTGVYHFRRIGEKEWQKRL